MRVNIMFGSCLITDGVEEHSSREAMKISRLGDCHANRAASTRLSETDSIPEWFVLDAKYGKIAKGSLSARRIAFDIVFFPTTTPCGLECCPESCIAKAGSSSAWST